MIKQLIRRLGHWLLGFDNYLFLFARFSVFKLRWLGSEKEFRFFMDLLPAGGAILDIGANIGAMTVAFARRHPEALIYAFEPMPANIRALQRILQHYCLEQQVRIMPYALGNREDSVEMLMPLVNRTKMQGYSHVIEPGHLSQEGEKIIVPMHTMDGVSELQALPAISGIKLDVENYEYFVLQGGASLLKKHRPIIYCELWDDARRDACVRFLAGMGYRIKVYEQGNLVDLSGQRRINFFFVPGDPNIQH